MPLSFRKQQHSMDCGPTCLYMVAKYFGKNISMANLRSLSQFNRDGVSLLGMADAAEKIGFSTRGVTVTVQQLMQDAPKPCILHWVQNHFVVLLPHRLPTPFFHRFIKQPNKIWVADPAKEIIAYTLAEFTQHWASTTQAGQPAGIALLLQPTAAFYKQADEEDAMVSWGVLVNYLRGQKFFVLQLIFGVLVGSMLQLVLPFLTQSMVDNGINTQNLQFIYIILAGQFMLFFSRTIVDFIRARILLHISSSINISLLSDFWIKLMKLPISYFDTKMTGDITQRINDNKRIQNFLTGSALNTFFSLFNFGVFSIVLLQYNAAVFIIFLSGSLLYFLWIKLFLAYRRKLDYERFAAAAKENTATMQLVFGMQEIKLHNAEHLKRWQWEGFQAALFKLSFKSLSLSQYQQAGAFFINEGKNIIITFFVAKTVLDGQLTLGAMLAVQYIIGQLNSPVEQLIGFAQQAQDAKMSLERLNEIHKMDDEEPAAKELSSQLPTNKSIHCSNVSFTYTGAGNTPVLKNVQLTIPQGKVTAIVGASGSGKTTLVKLLLKFYDSYEGDVKVGELSFSNFSARFWRSCCGSVLQDGFIFNDSIAKNIAVSDETPDYQRLLHACTIANILPFIEQLPLGFNTKIGAEGNGISQGQKQRILIARAVYKNPEYLFFDEATNALDATNEKIIMKNLTEFFLGKTVVIVAHRLSTVKNADTIVVLHNGEIVELGSHQQLTQNRAYYYELVKNQLELGN
ncbi:MAG: peptidase domain-containing ABC transporter [Bacteroidetes bacterium]|nr:MAG: peptidase domain-containing ABC transporter [Bacteroidota bacterium]